MSKILLIQSSPRAEASYSTQYARHVVDDIKRRHPDASVVVRDLAQTPLPHIGDAFVGALAASPQQRTAEQAQAIARSDQLIDELIAADWIVIASPMHNFGPPSTLKAWIDHIARAGRTFSYTEQGPRGLLTNKKAVLVLARNGIYSDGPMRAMDFQEPYLRAILGFIGITDVHVVRVEGLAFGQEAVQRAMTKAREEVDSVTRAVA